MAMILRKADQLGFFGVGRRWEGLTVTGSRTLERRGLCFLLWCADRRLAGC